MKKFYFNTEVMSGIGVLETLDYSCYKRVFLATDAVMLKIGTCDNLINILKAKNISYEIFSEIEPDPSLETVMKGVQKLVSFEADTIIAIGGGSVIDSAKAFMHFSTEVYKKANITKSKPTFIAIPTTSGTGSEVTSYAVVTDKVNKVKIPIYSNALLPDIAILDPNFTMTVPPQVTAETGMDVLAHALESYVSKNATAFTKPYSRSAVRRVFETLPEVVKNGANKEARLTMHEASCIAGIAFNNSGLGLVHAMAHSLGGRFHLPHGRANAILMPFIIDHNCKNSTTQTDYAYLAHVIGFAFKSDAHGAQVLKEAILQLNAHIGIKRYVTDYKVDRDEYIKAIPEMAKTAINDICLTANPIPANERDIEAIYMKLVQ